MAPPVIARVLLNSRAEPETRAGSATSSCNRGTLIFRNKKTPFIQHTCRMKRGWLFGCSSGMRNQYRKESFSSARQLPVRSALDALVSTLPLDTYHHSRFFSSLQEKFPLFADFRGLSFHRPLKERPIGPPGPPPAVWAGCPSCPGYKKYMACLRQFLQKSWPAHPRRCRRKDTHRRNTPPPLPAGSR